MGNDEFLQRLLGKDAKLGEMKLSLAEVLGEPDIVLSKVRVYLRERVYHRLPEVNRLFHDTMGSEVRSNIVRRPTTSPGIGKVMTKRPPSGKSLKLHAHPAWIM
jgi:hypothetical protein